VFVDDDAIPDWFDLSAHARTVRVRAPEAAIDVLPQPLTLGDAEPAGDGWVEVDITVAGDRRLEHLLVCLPPEAEVVAPEEYKELRREHARSLLEQFTR
jgi:predicted DNA-binding transcriptional regulator YafY